MIYSGLKSCFSCFFPPSRSSLSFTHSSIRCLRGAFSALLEFVNNQKHRSWLVCRVCVIFVGEHALGTLERDRQCNREREVDWGKENVRPSCCLVRRWRDIFYSVFPFHPQGPTLYLLPLWAGRKRQRWWYERKAMGTVTWKKTGNGGERRTRHIQGIWTFFLSPTCWEQKYKFIVCAQCITRKATVFLEQD